MEAILVRRITNRELAAGVFRAWGVFWCVYAFLALVSIIGALVHDPYASQPGMRGVYVSGQAINFACEILIFVFLVRRADWLARVVFPLETEMGTGIGAAELRTVLFAAIGLYFLVSGAVGGVGWLYQFVSSRRGREVSSYPTDSRRIVADLAEMLIGAGILLWARGSRGSLSSVRAAYDRTLGLGETEQMPPRD